MHAWHDRAEGRGGGSDAVARAGLLRDAGYTVTYFLDGDCPDTNQQAATLAGRGGQVVRWADGQNTECALCAALTPAGLRRFIELAVTALSNDGDHTPGEARQMIGDHLRPLLSDIVLDLLDPTTWSQHGVGLERARAAVAAASSKEKKGWFKRLESGKRLGNLLSTDGDLVADKQVQTVVGTLRHHISHTRYWQPARRPGAVVGRGP